jgi:hypothetical protein
MALPRSGGYASYTSYVGYMPRMVFRVGMKALVLGPVGNGTGRKLLNRGGKNHEHVSLDFARDGVLAERCHP